MDILGAKGASKELHQTVTEAVDKVTQEVLPGAERTGKNLEDHATYALYGLLADFANRLNGSSLPVDITITVGATIRISGKVGDVKLTVPEYEVK